MGLIDYTGKLNLHQDYLRILDNLEKKSEYIEMVLIDEKKTNDFVNTFIDEIISEKKVSEWWGTKTVAINKLIRLKSKKEIFEYLRKFETFCKYFETNHGDRSEVTDFGYDDIAFYDKRDNMLLCTTTHEGYIMIREDLTKIEWWEYESKRKNKNT